MLTTRKITNAVVSSILVFAIMLSGMQAFPASAQGKDGAIDIKNGVIALAPATYYVATTGNDTNDCATESTPCATINGAIGKANDNNGDTIKVAIGTYTGTGTEVALINKSVTLSGGWDADFITQNGMSTIDGQFTRRGVTVPSSMTAYMENFVIQNGDLAGGMNGVSNDGNLTLEKVTIKNNGTSPGSGNVSGINNSSTGTLTLSNSAVINNGSVNNCFGGILNQGSFTAKNSTISGNVSNTLYCYGAALIGYGTVSLQNVTIVGNIGATDMMGALGTFTLQNSLIGSCGNSTTAITSQGYNIISNNDCPITPVTGDQFGSAGAPIDLKITALKNNGGLTLTHALLGGSPAINAGNPATPGSGGGACEATDQRGVSRPVSTACDIGAFEGYITRVVSSTHANPNPTSASQVNFTVLFSEAVTGVDTTAPFNDFSLTTTGVTGASISAVSGSDDTYTVTVNTGSGNGSVRLNVVDDDTILDTSSNPLGGTGLANGNFNSGEKYTVLKIPTPQSPTGIFSDTTPTYKWSKIPNATKYQYQLWKGSTLVYAKIVASSVCATICSNTPTTVLLPGNYKWRVQAMTGGAWKSYSAFKSFTIPTIQPGFWSGPGQEFYVTPNQASVDNFAIYITVNGCGNYKITRTSLTPITNKHFAFTGSFYASGNFSTTTKASGSLGLSNYYIPGCGYLTGGPYSWSATWKNATQPTLMSIDGIMEIFVEPVMDIPSDFYSIESITP